MPNIHWLLLVPGTFSLIHKVLGRKIIRFKERPGNFIGQRKIEKSID